MRKLLLLIPLLSLINTTSRAQDAVETARQYIGGQSLLNNTHTEMSLSSSYLPTQGNHHYVYFNQELHGIGIYNSIYNVVVNKDNRVMHAANNFKSKLDNAEQANPETGLSLFEAISIAFESTGKASELKNLMIVQETKNTKGHVLKAKLINNLRSADTIIAKLEWLPLEYVEKATSNRNDLFLTWSLDFEGKSANNHWLIHIHKASGKVLRKTDLVIHCNFREPAEKHAKHTENHKNKNLKTETINKSAFIPNSYHVFDIPLESPNHGSRSIVTSPFTRFVPIGTGPGITNGWHDDGTTNYIITRGNNVWASEDVDKNNIPGFSPSNANLEFNYPYTQGLNTAATNQAAAITNLFYWNNLIHDILYKYGFDEPSGNFQTHNMGRGGAGGDHVIADAQDGSDTNNANFYTPVDGGNGRMQMYLFSPDSVYQPDSDFDNGIIAHEYGHGWSTRLTGGVSTNTCLDNFEQGGEGWSDYLALMLTTNWSSLSPDLASANIPRASGTYVLTQPTNGPGIRPYQYSYDMANINPNVTYGKVSSISFTYPHGIGSIWATILWDMTWEIIMQDAEIEDDIWNTSNMTGNVAALKLVHEGLRLQPCSPSFVDARDAIFMADSLFFSGRYKCSIDNVFTRRGLGAYATSGVSSNDRIVTEDFTPILGPKLSSAREVTVCSSLPFIYTLTSSTSSVNFSWTRPVVSGISNSAGSGTGAAINEILINTTPFPIEVVYLVTITPSLCSTSHNFHRVKVTVSPDNLPSIAEYNVCQNETIPSGEGLKGNIVVTPTPNILNESVILNSASPIYIKPSESENFYYKISTYTCNYPGSYVIQLNNVSGSGDPYLYVYSTFNPSSPRLNLLAANDDGGGIPNSRIIMNLSLGQTISIVSTDYYALNNGNFNLKVDPNFTPTTPVNMWYLNNSTPTALSNVFTFNPLLTYGSGVINTSNPGAHNYFYSKNADGTCRIPVTFSINESSVGGNITSSNPVCSGSGNTLTLNGYTGSILGWQQSTDNFTTITSISSTIPILVAGSIIENTSFRAEVKTEKCSSVFSSPITLSLIPTDLHILTNYSSETKKDQAIQKITAVNKISHSANIIYRAGQSVELNPGFEASNGSIFKTEIGGCEN